MIQRAEGPQCLGWRRSGVVDGSLTDDVRDRALAHLLRCPDCADDVEVERLLVARLRVLPDPAPSPRLMAALLQMGETGGPMPPRSGHVPGMPRPRPVPVVAQERAVPSRRPAPLTRAERPGRLSRETRVLRAGRPTPGVPLVVHRDGRVVASPRGRGPGGRPGGRRAVLSGAVGLVGAGVFAVVGLVANLPPDGVAGPVATVSVAPGRSMVEPALFGGVTVDRSLRATSVGLSGVSADVGGAADQTSVVPVLVDHLGPRVARVGTAALQDLMPGGTAGAR